MPAWIGVFCAVCVVSASAAQTLDQSERAMAGLMIARTLEADCGETIKWAGSSGATTFYAKNFKKLVSEGHAKPDLRKFERHGVKWLQTFIAWMEDDGVNFAALSKNEQSEVACDWAKAIANTRHPAGRFLARK